MAEPDTLTDPPAHDAQEDALNAGPGVVALPRTASQRVRIAEPILLAGVVVSAAALLATDVVATAPLQLAVLAIFSAVFAWALWDSLRDMDSSVVTVSRLSRAVVVAATAGAFEFAAPVVGWPWLWMLGLVAVYPPGLRRTGAVLFVVFSVLIEEFVTLHTAQHFNSSESVARVVSMISVGYLAYVWGRALDHTARAQRGVQMGEQRAQVIATYSDIVMIFADREFRVVHINRAIERTLGYTPRQIKRIWGSELLHPDDRPRFLRERHRLLETPGASAVIPVRVKHVNGHWVWFEVRVTNLMDQPSVRGFFASAIDVSSRVEAEQMLRRERSLLRSVVDFLPDYIYAKDREGRYLMSNRANNRRLGQRDESTTLGRRAMEFQTSDRSEIIERDDKRVVENRETIRNVEYKVDVPQAPPRWYRATKLPLLDVDGSTIGLVGVATDVTERKQFEAFLQHQATHDALTGLFNRRYFSEQLAEVMADPKRVKQPMALLFCDLDLFKGINDRYGHEVGDRFLQVLGERLVRFGEAPGRVLARFGGDEFVLFTPLSSSEDALEVAQSLLDSIRNPIRVHDLRLQTNASIGLATLHPSHKRPEDLIRDADAAMYQAKSQGRNRIAFFDDALRDRSSRRADLTEALRGALERKELRLVYQPKVDLRTGRVSGFEALMRWSSREYGMVPPVEFIPIAEETGLIVPYGLWALEEGCRQLREWQERYPKLDQLSIAVNVAMRQLLHDPFLDDVAGVLDRTQIYPAALELEITESAAMQNPEQTAELLRTLKNRGIRLALDDFGTGYSSLAYLRRLPIDVLKIDRAFVNGIESEKDDAEIVRLVIALARTMKLESVAEGIETRANAAELMRLGCDLGQGYYFSRPLPTTEADTLLDMNPTYVVE